MKNSKTTLKLVSLLLLFTLLAPYVTAQTKKLKRPKSRVGISSVDGFVQNSFDIYDKVYRYDSYAKSGTPLDDSDIDVLEDAIQDLAIVNESAPDILTDIDGAGIFKQSKATLQMNSAKKALKYSAETAKHLLANNPRSEGDEDGDTPSEDEDSSTETDEDMESSEDSENESEVEDENASDNLEVYSKFDFVPGDELLFFDDFSQDFVGDFPSKWNTNGTGEVVKLNKEDGNWFQIKAGYGIVYLPLVDDPLPEEYTIEFDILVKGIDNKTSSTAMLNVRLDDVNGFKDGSSYAFTGIPLGQYGAFNIRVANGNKGPNQINSVLDTDIRKAVLNKPHISIAVNKKRFRLWLNETKYVDIPQFIYAPESIKYLKFYVKGLKDGKEQLFISNLKIAKGGLDLRRQLMAEGRVSTNGILFDSGSANIKPQSYGIIRQISQVLLQDESITLNIIGHTDADGADDVNLKLSKNRAEAVKKALIDIYKISGDRLSTEGKGESEPLGDNATADGKAQNRRVEFVKT